MSQTILTTRVAAEKAGELAAPETSMTRPYARTLAYHKLHPEVSLERYVRAKVLETADRALARKRIYLDTRYWVALRDVQLQRTRNAIDKELLDTLIQLVRGGKAIC